ncbi:MAG: transketolase [Thermodesulfobacteriota bacterium]|nr:transketolase [Thermodesulfobacteriota bacterium]
MDPRIPNSLRFLSIDAIQKAKSGHPGMPMGMADVATILFTEFLKFDPKKPSWADRDRFVLSNGHGSMLLYSLLYLLGYPKLSINDIKQFRQLGSNTPGHPEYGFTAGVETTTGPLAQGLGNAVGMALAERIHNDRFGDKLVNHNTYVFLGDGCLMEGLSHEALSFAGHMKLNKLIAFFDDNKISIDGPTSLSTSDNIANRIASYGWEYIKIDGHNHNQIRKAILRAKKSKRPSMIACQTRIGFGSPNKEGSEKSHGAALGIDEVEKTRLNLDWTYRPFEIPQDIINFWRKSGRRSSKIRARWESNLKNNPRYREFNKSITNSYTESLIRSIYKEFSEKNNKITKISTRKASEKVLDVLVPKIPELVGGSADLTPSNNTKIQSMPEITSKNYGGQYIHYGVREHGMASIMNGLSLHKGVVPYGGTFLIFTDYCRPSIRLSAIMGLKVIYIMTHDSIGLGEDGTTHQPVEHLLSLRSIPNLYVYRPCDLNETLECWVDALVSDQTSIIALSRQDLSVLTKPQNISTKNIPEASAKVIFGSQNKRDITIVASGSEVEIAVSAAKKISDHNIKTTVVSMSCIEKFLEKPTSFRRTILGNAPIIVVEAGLSLGWRSYFDDLSNVVSVESFGASAPKEQLYKYFKITQENIIRKARKIVKR